MDKAQNVAKPDSGRDYQPELGMESRGMAGGHSFAKADTGGKDRSRQRSIFYEPPYAERHVRWCERTVGKLITYFLLDFMELKFT